MNLPDNLAPRGADGIRRCWWCGTDPEYVAYHDDEWGHYDATDRGLFEKLSLEGFQSGLSWLTILRKRANFRAAFANFDFDRIARWNQRSVERLLRDAGIVRHRGKIESVLNNAKRAREMRDECGTLSAFFEPYREDDRPFPGVVSQTDATKKLSKELKKRGWSFVGPTTLYAFLQSTGHVNDHVPDCAFR